MSKKSRIPKFIPSPNIKGTEAPLVVQEGAKFPWEFIELRDKEIPNAKSQKFKAYYKEKRVYRPRPVYQTFEEFPEELKKVFEIAIEVFGNEEVNWIRLKRFLNDKSHPKSRWLWGFSLRHRGTEKIKINQNDLIILYEWKSRTGISAKIPMEKIFEEDKAYVQRLEGILRASKVYGDGKSIEWIKKLYLVELEKEKNDEQATKKHDSRISRGT